MKLNEAVRCRFLELLKEKNMTQYQLYMKSGVPKSTIGNIINCSYESVKLRVILNYVRVWKSTLKHFSILHFLMKKISNHKTTPSIREQVQ